MSDLNKYLFLGNFFSHILYLGGDCTQIYAEVRENGTNAKFTGCTNV